MPSVTDFAGQVPHNYETYLGPLFFEPYAIDLVERIGERRFKSVLELACGTGRVTRHLLSKLATDGHLVATDLNPDMLRVAGERVGDKRVEWSVADAHALPFGDASFELAVCQYGVMFFSDKPKALRQVWRVLQPGGVFYFNTWDSLEHNAVSQLAMQALTEIFPEDPPTFFERGPYSLHDIGLIQSILEEAGFGQIEIKKVHKTSVAPSGNDVMKGILDGTPVSAFLNENAGKADAVRQRLRQKLVEQYGEINLILPMQAFVVKAVKNES